MNNEYVVGFLFDLNFDKVVLIEKQKPEWQKGFLNGVGGKIENSETPTDAMAREFKEEVGYYIKDWECICEMKAKDCTIYFFKARFNTVMALPGEMPSKTDEKVGVYRIANLFHLKTIPNLKWLIPMCLDPDHDFVLARTSNSMKK